MIFSLCIYLYICICMYLDPFLRSITHSYNLWISTPLFFFLFVFTYTGLLLFFCYKLVLMFLLFSCPGWNSSGQRNSFCVMMTKGHVRHYVWFVVILSFSFSQISSSSRLHSLFLYVDYSSYLMYNIRDVLNKRKQLVVIRQMSKRDYYYYYYHDLV